MKKELTAVLAAAMALNVSAINAEAAEAEENAENNGFAIEARYFAPQFNGHVQTDSLRGATGSDRVDFKNDLGYSNETPTEFILKYNNVSVDWVHLHNKGDVNRDFELNGNTYRVGSASSVLNIDYIKAKVENNLLNVGNGKLKWDYGITAMKFDVSADGTAFGISYSDSESIWAPLPTVGVKYQVPLAQNLTGSVGISGIYAGSYGYLYDLEAGLKYTPISYLSINAGYRDIKLSIEHNDDNAGIRLNGPFVGVQYNF